MLLSLPLPWPQTGRLLRNQPRQSAHTAWTHVLYQIHRCRIDSHLSIKVDRMLRLLASILTQICLLFLRIAPRQSRHRLRPDRNQARESKYRLSIFRITMYLPSHRACCKPAITNRGILKQEVPELQYFQSPTLTDSRTLRLHHTSMGIEDRLFTAEAQVRIRCFLFRDRTVRIVRLVKVSIPTVQRQRYRRRWPLRMLTGIAPRGQQNRVSKRQPEHIDPTVLFRASASPIFTHNSVQVSRALKVQGKSTRARRRIHLGVCQRFLKTMAFRRPSLKTKKGNRMG